MSQKNTTVHLNSNTHQILMFIRERPEGTTRREIADAFHWLRMVSLDPILARLRNHNLIYNDGVMGAKGATWYPVTHEVEEPFPTIAAELVDELKNVYYDGHELYLARRLKEIFG